ncbi:5209_t:CDS:1, partial [Gigaspora rosea]
IEGHPSLFKIGLDIGDDDNYFENRITQHEDGKCAAVFAEGYVTPVHEDCRIIDGAIRRILVEYRIRFKCNCDTNHQEYYDVNSLSTFDEVESWFHSNPISLLVSKIQQ